MEERGRLLLSEYQRQIKSRFPSLQSSFSNVSDPRKRKDYSMAEILMGGLGMFLFKQGSRNSINNKRREEHFRSHYQQCFGLRLPHQDTVVDVLEELDPGLLEQVKMDLASAWFEQKWLRGYRLLGKYYMVAVDATGVVSFDHRHCSHCLTRKSKSGQVTYFHYVLEAKLVTDDGFSLSLGCEWIENSEGQFDKQDCERKAFVRLAQKLKKQYPRLPICILADGLYPSETSFDICEKNEWKYIFVLQENSLKTVQQELVLPRRRNSINQQYVVKDGWRINRHYRCEKAIPYHDKYALNWFQCLETRKKDVPVGKQSTVQPQTSCFEYLTNLEPQANNIIELSQGGRLRWKVENEGFNSQKCGGYDLEHKYCRNSYNGMKNYYTLLQIAHAINQLVEKSREVTTLLKRHSKETVRNIWNNLVAYMLLVQPTQPLPPPSSLAQPHPT